MKNLNKGIIKILIFMTAAGYLFSCASTYKIPPLSEAEKAIILISGFDDKTSVEVKRLNESCKPVGALEYINEVYVNNPLASKLTRARAVEVKADTVHYYYYDDVRKASIVRFWKCN